MSSFYTTFYGVRLNFSEGSRRNLPNPESWQPTAPATLENWQPMAAVG